MKGVRYLVNSDCKRTAVQIDLKVIEKYRHDMDDLIDGIIAESRKDEERMPLAEVIAKMSKKHDHS